MYKWAGWGQLGTVKGIAVPEDVYVLRGRYAPHDWLFPRCAAVVHHGGAGRAPITDLIGPIVCAETARAQWDCGGSLNYRLMIFRKLQVSDMQMRGSQVPCPEWCPFSKLRSTVVGQGDGSSVGPHARLYL